MSANLPLNVPLCMMSRYQVDHVPSYPFINLGIIFTFGDDENQK